MKLASPGLAYLLAPIFCFGLLATAVADTAADTAQQPRKLGLAVHSTWGSKDVTVKKVRPESLAERAGFRAGDLILTVNGKALTEYSRPELGALFGSTTPLSFEVDRDGRRLVIVVE
jgi:S1-C subfamily serine protease